MSRICSYEGCMVRRLPCGSVAFFMLPTDNRRQLWIVNSGNKDLTNIDDKRTCYFCENHFHASDIRSQFNRKTLRRWAVPIPYKSTTSENKVEQSTSYNSPAEDSSKPTNSPLDDNSTGDPCYEIDYLLSEEAELREILISIQNNESPKILDQSHDEEEMIDEERAASRAFVKSKESDAKEMVEEERSESIRQETVITTNNPNYKLLEAEKSTHNPDRTYEDDKHFALSLVGYFQRLNSEKKAIAKLKILKYLTALELGRDCDI